MYTDGTLLIERTEPATAQAKHAQDEQWYARVNSECDCGKTEKCGDKYRELVPKITAEGVSSNAQLRKRLKDLLYNVSRSWTASSKHYSELSATCDHKRMPRELLPRLGRRNSLLPDKWPYLSQHTVNDVQVMRLIRSKQSHRSFHTVWATLQQRLEQHASTGAGTVAEAIAVNDYWWDGQVAHEKPSGSRAAAMQRRYSKP